MKYHECDSLFHYTWDKMAQALWQRYPNPQSCHVLSEDTLSRRLEGSKLFSTRLLTKTNRMPKWGERVVKARKVAVVEHSVVDSKTRVMQTYTVNVGLTRFMSCVEHVIYRPASNNSGATVAVRKTWISSSIFGLGFAIQKYGIDRYKKNIERTDQGLLHVLNRLFPRPQQHPTHAAAHDTRHRLRETAQRAKQLLQDEQARIAVARGEPNTSG